MIAAIATQERPDTETAADYPAVQGLAAPDRTPRRCAVRTLDGRHLTAALASVTDAARPERVCVTDLETPGALLDAYIGRGMRRFLVAVEGGPALLAELGNMAWRARGGRLCCFSIAPAVPPDPEPNPRYT